MAVLLHVAPDAEMRLDGLRDALAGAASECGASAWNGLLVAASSTRTRRPCGPISPEPASLPRRALPRSWQT
jgi:hypothetical protein